MRFAMASSMALRRCPLFVMLADAQTVTTCKLGGTVSRHDKDRQSMFFSLGNIPEWILVVDGVLLVRASVSMGGRLSAGCRIVGLEDGESFYP